MEFAARLMLGGAEVDCVRAVVHRYHMHGGVQLSQGGRAGVEEAIALVQAHLRRHRAALDSRTRARHHYKLLSYAKHAGRRGVALSSALALLWLDPGGSARFAARRWRSALALLVSGGAGRSRAGR